MAKLENRYANALLELSMEKNSLEKDLEQALFVLDTLKKPQTYYFILNPHTPDAAKQQLFQSAFSNKLANHLMGFFCLMVKKNRESLIVPVLTEYINLANKQLGKLRVKIVSAKPLTEKQLETIRTVLTKKTHIKQLDMELKVDPDLIGGFYMLINDFVFDSTVRTDLINLKESLKRGKINVYQS